MAPSSSGSQKKSQSFNLCNVTASPPVCTTINNGNNSKVIAGRRIDRRREKVMAGNEWMVEGSRDKKSKNEKKLMILE